MVIRKTLEEKRRLPPESTRIFPFAGSGNRRSLGEGSHQLSQICVVDDSFWFSWLRIRVLAFEVFIVVNTCRRSESEWPWMTKRRSSTMRLVPFAISFHCDDNDVAFPTTSGEGERGWWNLTEAGEARTFESFPFTVFFFVECSEKSMMTGDDKDVAFPILSSWEA